MDNRSRNFDRADPLRGMSQAVARGASQVLQFALRGQLQLAHLSKDRDERERRTADGDQISLDLTARCERCGDPLPPGSRANRLYCSHRCSNRSNTELKAQQRREAREGRRCKGCGCSISIERRIAAQYCSEACRLRSTYAEAVSKPTGVCCQCGAAFASAKQEQTHCSRRCAWVTRRAQMGLDFDPTAHRACAHCGNVFQPKKPTHLFCTKSCASRHRAAPR